MIRPITSSDKDCKQANQVIQDEEATVGSASNYKRNKGNKQEVKIEYSVHQKFNKPKRSIVRRASTKNNFDPEILPIHQVFIYYK